MAAAVFGSGFVMLLAALLCYYGSRATFLSAPLLAWEHIEALASCWVAGTLALQVVLLLCASIICRVLWLHVVTSMLCIDFNT
jgi:hypothetical protein